MEDIGFYIFDTGEDALAYRPDNPSGIDRKYTVSNLPPGATDPFYDQQIMTFKVVGNEVVLKSLSYGLSGI